MLDEPQITRVESFTQNGQFMYRVYFRVFQTFMGDILANEEHCYTLNPDNPNEIMDMVNEWIDAGNEVESV